MTEKSANGYPVLSLEGTKLWKLPLEVGQSRSLRLRPGDAGFLLTHFSLFFHEVVESLTDRQQLDDWSYSRRMIGGTQTWSNHASGTAVDLNAVSHPQHAKNTFSKDEVQKIHERLGLMDGCIEWGGDWSDEYVDEMHFEIAKNLKAIKKTADRLRESPRGKRILKIN